MSETNSSAPTEHDESSEIEAVRQAFVELWGSMGPFWGISPTAARVYSWLLSLSEPADTEDMMAGLELSRGAVSMACRDLRNWGLIYPQKASGSRRVTYTPATDLEKVTRNIVLIRKRREWDPILENLKEWIPRLEAEKSPEAEIFRSRLESIEALVALADSMVEVFLKGGMVGKLGLKLLVKASRKIEHRPQEPRSHGAGSHEAGFFETDPPETEMAPTDMVHDAEEPT